MLRSGLVRVPDTAARPLGEGPLIRASPRGKGLVRGAPALEPEGMKAQRLYGGEAALVLHAVAGRVPGCQVMRFRVRRPAATELPGEAARTPDSFGVRWHGRHAAEGEETPSPDAEFRSSTGTWSGEVPPTPTPPRKRGTFTRLVRVKVPSCGTTSDGRTDELSGSAAVSRRAGSRATEAVRCRARSAKR
jgi:hypothetical protein